MPLVHKLVEFFVGFLTLAMTEVYPSEMVIPVKPETNKE